MNTLSIAVAAPSHAPRSRWAKLGLAGFLFFLAKGLIWLILATALWLGS